MVEPGRLDEPEQILSSLCKYLRSGFGCHTAILYGSCARGEWGSESDIDVVAFRDGGSDLGHVAHRWEGRFLDLFLYCAVPEPSTDVIRLQDGRVLFEQGTLGTALLSGVHDLIAAGPRRLGPREIRSRRLWAEKMLARAQQGGAGGDYRRHWLLTALLEDYFELRGEWYLGPNRSFDLLRRERPTDYGVLSSAFHPSAALADIHAAVVMVCGPPESAAGPFD